ncbi:MAG: hypothetical protein BIFFINMI_02514 [Phycisphaerae bacterium]|nr:hypothetical protein [Phycisphaerae bacterium]
MKGSTAIAALLLAVTSARGGQVKFASPPVAERNGDRTLIRFAASEPTDVEVAILDKAGSIVRHVAAGVLGPNAPAPLKPDSLDQSLAWDGADDIGAPVPADRGPFRVRVGLGTTAKLGRVLFDEPGISFAPRAVNVGPDGLLYVLMEHGQTKSTFLLQAFTKEGKYVRTVMPYPANLAADGLAGLPRAKLPDGRIVPQIYLHTHRDLYPLSTGMRPQTMPITRDGRIVLVNASKTHNGGLRDQHILYVNTDGSVPASGYVGPFAGGEKIAHGLCFVALSPDGKCIYTAGQRKGNGNDDRMSWDAKSTPPHHVVYRVGLDDKELAKPFIGELYKAGDDHAHLSRPRGLATDAAGRVYVCDYDNGRVAVFDAEGKWAGQVDCPAAEQVAVDSRSGVIYVVTYKVLDYRKRECRLVRFPGIGKPASTSIDLDGSYPAMALDTAGESPVIWLARTFFDTWENPQPRRGVEKVVDDGGTLSEPVEVIRHRQLPDVFQIAASPVNDDVFIHSYSEHQFARVDGRTGETKLLDKIRGHDVGVGPDGSLYVLRSTRYSPGEIAIDRFDREGQPLPMPGLTTNELAKLPMGVSGHGTTASKGFAVSPRGEIMIEDRGEDDSGSGLTVYAPDGTIRSRLIVTGTQKSDGSPVLDAAGNIYLGVGMMPPGWTFPGQMDAKVSSLGYANFYGSVVKFPAAGGRLIYQQRRSGAPVREGWPPAGADAMTKMRNPLVDAFIAGATWVHPGFAVVPAGHGCGCYTDRFTVDRFGRVFIPDTGAFEVAVVDAANNPILRFGDYGNEDSAGAGSRIATPGIPMAWPYAVSVGRGGVYVTDFINRRILRVDLVPSAEATCETR